MKGIKVPLVHPAVSTIKTTRSAQPAGTVGKPQGETSPSSNTSSLEAQQQPVQVAFTRKRNPKKQWQEDDFHVPARPGRTAAHHVPAPRDNSFQGPPLEALVPQAGSSDSPLSHDSTASRTNFVLRASRQRSRSPDARLRHVRGRKPMKRGGPCIVCWARESSAWRVGVEQGMFPGMVMCNRHGTLDMRGRLWQYADVEGIRELHSSDMDDEDKAAVSVLFYQEGRAGKKKAAGNAWADASVDEEEPRINAKSKGKAIVNIEAGQPWVAQSPTHHRAPTQAASAVSEQQPVVSQAGVGGRERKNSSSTDGSHCEEALQAPRSKRRQLFAKPATCEKSSSSSALQDAVDVWLQQAGLVGIQSAEKTV